MPAHLFDYNVLFRIGSVIGKPLQVDAATARKSRLFLARICVELDLVKERMHEIFLNIGGEIIKQQILYEVIPPYCNDCKHIGHRVEDCYANGNKPRPQPRKVAVSHPKEVATANPINPSMDTRVPKSNKESFEI